MVDICEKPTKPKIKQLQISNGLLIPYYPSRTLIVIGIISIISGILLTVFGSLSILIEATQLTTICNGMWIGIIVLIQGFIVLLSGHRPFSNTLLYINLFISIIVTGATGFLSILTATSVINWSSFTANIISSTLNTVTQLNTTTTLTPQSLINIESSNVTTSKFQTILDTFNSSRNIEEQNHQITIDDIHLAKIPLIVINSLLLFLATLACLLSLTILLLTIRNVFKMNNQYNYDFCLNSHLNNLNFDLYDRRQRIIKWLIEQSISNQNVLTNKSSLLIQQNNNQNKEKQIYSNSTLSSRISAYN